MIRPTMISGQTVFVRNTPAAARITPTFAARSLREQIHADRMLMSSERWRVNRTRQILLATSAMVAVTPMIDAFGVMLRKQLVGNLGQHAEPEQQHGGALQRGRAGAGLLRSPDHHEADAVHQGIAQHIERVGQQRGGPGQEPGRGLDHKHAGIDGQHDPEDSSLPRPEDLKLVRFCIATMFHARNSATAS